MSNQNRVCGLITLAVGSAVAVAGPEPVFVGEATIPASFQRDFPCAANEDATVGFKVTSDLLNNDIFEFHSIDLTSGSTLDVIDSLSVDGLIGWSDFIHISGDRAYLLPDLTIVDISDPANLAVLGSEPGFGWSSFNSRDSYLAVQGTTVFVITGNTTVTAYDCADPSNITVMGTFSVPGPNPLSSIDSIGDDKLIIGKGFNPNGIAIYDTSTPTNPTLLGEVAGVKADTLDVNDDNTIAYAFRFDGNATEVVSIDVADPTNALVLDRIDLSDLSFYENTGPIVAVGNNIVAVHVWFDQVELIDTSDPTDLVRLDPIFEGSVDLARADDDTLILSTRKGVALYDFVVCAADFNGDDSLDFFDISAFINAFASQDPAADFNNDGLFNFFDISEFISDFNAGCP